MTTTDYTCAVCGGRWARVLETTVSCAVMHPAGDCCHYGETRVTKRERTD